MKSETDFSKIQSEYQSAPYLAISNPVPPLNLIAVHKDTPQKENIPIETNTHLVFNTFSEPIDRLIEGFKSLPMINNLFTDVRPQPMKEFDINNLKHTSSKDWLERDRNRISSLSPLTLKVITGSSPYFVDQDFKPLPSSILDNIKDPSAQVERRLEWRRAMFLSNSEKLQMWPASYQSRGGFKSQLPGGVKLAALLEILALNQQLTTPYAGSDWSVGKHCFLLYNQNCQPTQVLVDDYLPAVFVQNHAIPAFLRPYEYDGKLYLLGSLLEKALAKVFGSYLHLHKAPIGAILQVLFGSCVNFRSQTDSGIERLGLGKQDKTLFKCYHSEDNVADSFRDSELMKNPAFCVSRLDNGNLLGTPVASCRLSEASAGLFLRIKGNNGAFLNLKVAINKTDFCKRSLVHLTIINQQTLDTSYQQVLSVYQLGYVDLSNLADGSYFLLSKFENFDLQAEFFRISELEISPLETQEIEKLNRGLTRKLFGTKPQDSPILNPLEIDRASTSSQINFKIGNYSKVPGRLLTIKGVQNFDQWMVEVNGRSVKTVAEKSRLVLSRQEEEFVKLYARSPDQNTDEVQLIAN